MSEIKQIVNTRSVADVIFSNTLLQSASELDTAADHAVEDYLHSGLLTFPNAFLNESDGKVNLTKVILYEYDTTLWMPDCRLLLLNPNECDIAPVKNDVLNFTAGCTYEHVLAEIDFVGADWKSQGHKPSGSIVYYHAKAGKSVDEILSNAPLDNTVRRSCDLVGFLLVKGSNLSKFQTGAKFKVGLQLIQL